MKGMKGMKGIMNFHDAHAAFEPTVFDNAVPLNRAPMSSERTHIENSIHAKERQIAQLAQEIRWLRLELETV